MPKTETRIDVNPAIQPLVTSLVGNLSRRRFLGVAIGAAVAVGSITLGRWRAPNIFDNPIEAVQRVTQVSERIDGFLKAPKPIELIAQSYRYREGFYFSPEEIGNISLYIFGDSMNLLDGTRVGSDGTNQKGSWGDALQNSANAFLKRLGIRKEWGYYNYAIPGSSTVGLVGDESYDHNAQLGNEGVQRQIVDDPHIPIIAIGLNGNNWRKTAQYAIELYQTSSNFKSLMDTLDMTNQNFAQQLIDKGEQLVALLNDPTLCAQLNTLINYFEEDSRRFEEGFRQSLEIVKNLNQKRKAKKMPAIRLAVTLPIDMALRDVVPYAPLNAPRGVREEFDYGSIPNGKEAVYKVTSTIYKTASKLLRQYSEEVDFPEAITVPFFGLEEDQSLFFHDGHFNLAGEMAVANIFLKRILTLWQGEKQSLMNIEDETMQHSMRRRQG